MALKNLDIAPFVSVDHMMITVLDIGVEQTPTSIAECV
jgi:hypothetical protein